MPDQRPRFPFSLPQLLISVGIMLIVSTMWGTPARQQLSYSDFKSKLREGQIAQVQIGAHTLHVQRRTDVLAGGNIHHKRAQRRQHDEDENRRDDGKAAQAFGG